MSLGDTIPIDFVKKKTGSLSDELIDDLELHSYKDCSGSGSLWNDLWGLDHVADQAMSRHMATLYTWDVSFLSQTQSLLKKKAFELEKEEVDNSREAYVRWQELMAEPNFLEKYQYVEWGWAQPMNRLPQAMQAASMYHMTSPILSLALPLVLLVVPFFLLKYRGVDISFATYASSLKAVVKHHAFGRLFGEFGGGGWDKRVYLIISAMFYVFQIYQNVCACVRFQRNMFAIHETLAVIRKHLASYTQYMSRLREKMAGHGAYAMFDEMVAEEVEDARHLTEKLSHIKPHSLRPGALGQIGTVMSTFYKLRKDEDVNRLVERSFSLYSYMKTMQGVQSRLDRGQINTFSFGKRTSMKDAVYPPMLTGPSSDAVPNSFSLKKHQIITGPNASGKTTLLKTILSNTILCQQVGAGCFSKASISPYSQYHCYLNIPDTAGRDSLFQAEARRCAEMLRDIEKDKSGKHLCVFDELYSGTNPYEATACGTAFLRHLGRKRNVNFALTTHYTRLCKTLSKQSNIENIHMECIPVYDGAKDPSHPIDFTYSFRKRDGISSHRGGIKVLRDLDYPEEVTVDAQRLIRSIVF